VPELAADNFLEEAFARPARGPRDRGGGPYRDSRSPRDHNEARGAAPERDAPDVGVEKVEEVEGVEDSPEAEEAVVQESDDS
ncbi:MAG: hypothetical protein OXN90_05070, partial [Gemmatimonadota bacterium]|nr:hypothetical protein [Gemmatimonadota bacterium]